MTLSGATEGLIGETTVVNVTFRNAGTAVGYGPFVELTLPSTGADGAGDAVDDGISFVSATYLGFPIPSSLVIVGTFPPSGSLEHPVLRTPTGTPVLVTGNPGDEFVVLRLPFSSTPTQPPVAMDVTLRVSELADVGVPLVGSARGGFQYGADPLDNPTVDPPIVGTQVSGRVTPTAWRMTKTYLGPENETATGPSFPHQYRIDVDVANGQVVTDLDLTDRLPIELQFVGGVTTLVNGAPAATTAVETPSTTQPGGVLTAPVRHRHRRSG